MPDDNTTMIEVGATTATDAIESASRRSPMMQDVESEAGEVTVHAHT